MQFSVMLRERDEQISHLASRNEYLEKALKIRNTELVVQTTRNERTDRLLEDWTAGLRLSDSTASVNQSEREEPDDDVVSTLSSVKTSLSSREKKIARLEEEKTVLESSVITLQDECNTLREENESLVEEKKRMKEKFVRSMEELKRATQVSAGISVAAQNSESAIESTTPTSPRSSCKKVARSISSAKSQKSLPKLTELKKKTAVRKNSDVTCPVIVAVQREEKRRTSMPSMTGGRATSSSSTSGPPPHKH